MGTCGFKWRRLDQCRDMIQCTHLHSLITINITPPGFCKRTADTGARDSHWRRKSPELDTGNLRDFLTIVLQINWWTLGAQQVCLEAPHPRKLCLDLLLHFRGTWASPHGLLAPPYLFPWLSGSPHADALYYETLHKGSPEISLWIPLVRWCGCSALPEVTLTVSRKSQTIMWASVYSIDHIYISSSTISHPSNLQVWISHL
jgi:hypothetical protein